MAAIAAQKISPCLWFDGQALEAAEFYCSLFEGSRIVSANPIMVVFELAGQRFQGLNGGPQFTFNEAISLSVSCADQAEVDRFWNALTANGGTESQCAWLKDKYGLSWQIVPTALVDYLGDPDPGRRERATEAMLKMKKIVLADLAAAADAA